MQFIQQAREWLAAINPALPAIVLIIVVWAPQAAIRKWLPKIWEVPASFGPKGQELRRVWQALPSVLAGALIGAMSSQGDPWDAVVAALVGALAPVWHHFLKASPVPYEGELGKRDDDNDDPPGNAPVGLVAALAFTLVACSPAQWQAQRPYVDGVAQASNDVVLPALKRGYTDAGLAAVAAAETREDAALRLEIVRRQWAPVFDAHDAFAAAHSAWALAVETEGDVLATADAVRDAYCQLRDVAGAKVKLPQLPVPALECAQWR